MENKNEQTEVEFLRETVKEQYKLIKTMKDVLRFCARGDAGTFYQQESAREMLHNNTHLVWDRYNADGTTAESYRKWIHECAEGREKGGGDKALEKLDEYEKELLGN